MQKAIKGIYVFFVAFYLTELTLIVFEALHETHRTTYPPVVIAAMFIPLFILVGLVLSGILPGKMKDTGFIKNLFNKIGKIKIIKK